MNLEIPLYADECDLRELGIVVNDVVEIFILISMIVASVWVSFSNTLIGD